MDLQASGVEAVIHFALFVTGGLAGAAGVLAAVERLAGDGRRVVRLPWLGAAVGLFGLVFAAERLYHAI